MALQRPHRGSRVSSFYPVKSLPPISSLDSAFQLQEYISLLIRLDVHDVDAIVSIPEKPVQKDHDEPLDPPEHDSKKPDDPDRRADIAVDKACWIYEQLRRLAQDLSHPLITMLQQECTRSTCPQMKAGEWLYLCVAHGNDGAMEQCCAIDYILHTVDSATALLNSPRAFPSRLSIPPTSHRHFSSLARRLGRIFAHAYFHHREAFEQAEAESSLYARFLKLTHQFDLVPTEFLVIPESAIHHDDDDDDDKAHPHHVEPPRLYSAAVHPSPMLQNNTLTADPLSDVPLASVARPKAPDVANQLLTDSPRRLGRSRTDTMVFSEAFSLADDLSKSEDNATSNGSLLHASPIDDSQSLVLAPSWPDLHATTEDVDDEDIGDAHSDSNMAGPLSPPVEELPLISLEETSNTDTPDEAAPVSPPESSPQEPPSDTLAVESGSEESIQVVDAPEENAPADEPFIPEVAESTLEEADAAASEALAESTQDLPGPEESVTESVSEGVHLAPLPSDEESQATEMPLVESESPPRPEPLLELNEPPPSEPIPPESESDITDEAGGLDGDEVKLDAEEAVVGE